MAGLAGKVAIITGGTKGIGAAASKLLVAQGAKVVASYGGDKAAADSFVKELGADNVLAIQADGGTLMGVDDLVNAAVKQFKKIDIVIPNAAVMHMVDIEHVTEAQFDQAYALNVKGPMFLVQKSVPHMQPGSKVVFMSTTQTKASTVTPPYALYCSTKGAIEQLTRTLAKDLGRKGINVNAVAPGPTGTDLFYKGKSEQLLKTIAGFNPFNKIAEPDEVAEAMVYLSGDGARWINGQIIYANGGMA